MVSGPSPMPNPVKSDPRPIIHVLAVEWMAPKPPAPNIFHVWEFRNELWQRVGSLELDELRGLWMPVKKVWVEGAGKGVGRRVEVEEWTLTEEERVVVETSFKDECWWSQEVNAHFPPPTNPNTRNEPWMIHTNYLNNVSSSRWGLLAGIWGGK